MILDIEAKLDLSFPKFNLFIIHGDLSFEL
jgi:hypothetical protein